MSQLFTNLKCSGTPCYTSILTTKPKLQIALFTSENPNPLSNQVQEVTVFRQFNYNENFQRFVFSIFMLNKLSQYQLIDHTRCIFSRHLDIELPAGTRKNGTLYLHVVLANDNAPFKWQHLQREGLTVMQRIKLTEYMEPRAATFNLLGGNGVSLQAF